MIKAFSLQWWTDFRVDFESQHFGLMIDSQDLWSAASCDGQSLKGITHSGHSKRLFWMSAFNDEQSLTGITSVIECDQHPFQKSFMHSAVCDEQPYKGTNPAIIILEAKKEDTKRTRLYSHLQPSRCPSRYPRPPLQIACSCKRTRGSEIVFEGALESSCESRDHHQNDTSSLNAVICLAGIWSRSKPWRWRPFTLNASLNVMCCHVSI